MFLLFNVILLYIVKIKPSPNPRHEGTNPLKMYMHGSIAHQYWEKAGEGVWIFCTWIIFCNLVKRICLNEAGDWAELNDTNINDLKKLWVQNT